MYIVRKRMPPIRGMISLPEFRAGCEFKVQKFRSDGLITYEGPWFHNVVLNIGLDFMRSWNVVPGDGHSLIEYINVGTGTSDPSFTDTGLGNRVATTAKLYGSLTTDHSPGDIGESLPSWRWWQRTFEFSVGFLSANTNLTELGLSRFSDSEYFNRELFRDGNGDPTAITVKGDEGIRITVRSTLYASMAHNETIAASFGVDGITRAATTKLVGSAWRTSDDHIMPGHWPSGPKAVYVATADGSFVEATSYSDLPYTDGDHYRDRELTWYPGTFVGDWKRIRTGWSYGSNVGGYMWEIVLDEAISIADTEEIKMTVRRSWGRV